MSNTRGNVVCPNCGRVFRGVGSCPNCGYGADFYERAYSVEGYSVSSGTAIPRWLLLAGTLVLLSALVYVVAPRNTGGRNVAGQEAAPPERTGNGGAVLGPGPAGFPAPPSPSTAPAARVAVPATRKSPSAAASPKTTPDDDREFWRRKSERELREATQHVPTREELQARDYYQWQNHIGVSNESRAADYVIRRR